MDESAFTQEHIENDAQRLARIVAEMDIGEQFTSSSMKREFEIDSGLKYTAAQWRKVWDRAVEIDREQFTVKDIKKDWRCIFM